MGYKGEVQGVRIGSEPDVDPTKRQKFGYNKFKKPETSNTPTTSYPSVPMVVREARALLMSMTTRPASEYRIRIGETCPQTIKSETGGSASSSGFHRLPQGDDWDDWEATLKEEYYYYYY